MLDKLDNYHSLLLVGRVALVFIYFLGGLGVFLGQIPIDFAASKGVPEFLVWLAFLLKAFGGFSIIIGYQVRIFALALAVFTILTAFIFHEFMGTIFLKEISMIGGLLILAVVGGGKFSVDERLKVMK